MVARSCLTITPIYDLITEAIDWRLPPTPGTAPIPAGHVRLYHQTDEDRLGSIKRHGIQLAYAQGTEGPKAIYADTKGFYGKPENGPTVEFHVPQARWDRPFVRIAIHRPWHRFARSIERDPSTLNAVLTGKRDCLLYDPYYGKALRYIKHKYANPVLTGFNVGSLSLCAPPGSDSLRDICLRR